MSEHPQEQTEAKLLAYIEGELDDAGRADIDRHLEANPKHRRLLADLAAGRDMVRRLPRESAPPDLYENFQAQLERQVLLEPAVDVNPETGNFRLKSRWGRLRAAAAAAVVAGGLGVIVYSAMPRRPGPGPTVSVKSPTAPADAPQGTGPAAVAPPATKTSVEKQAAKHMGPDDAGTEADKNKDAERGRFRGGAVPDATGAPMTVADGLRRERMARAADRARALPGVQVAVSDAYKRKAASDPTAGAAASGTMAPGAAPGGGAGGGGAGGVSPTAAAGPTRSAGRAGAEPLYVVVASADPSAAEVRVNAALQRVGLYARADNVYAQANVAASARRVKAQPMAADAAPVSDPAGATPPAAQPAAPSPSPVAPAIVAPTPVAPPTAAPPPPAPHPAPAGPATAEPPATMVPPSPPAKPAAAKPTAAKAAPPAPAAPPATVPPVENPTPAATPPPLPAEAAPLVTDAVADADADVAGVLVIRGISRSQAADLVVAMNQPGADVYAAAYDVAGVEGERVAQQRPSDLAAADGEAEDRRADGAREVQRRPAPTVAARVPGSGPSAAPATAPSAAAHADARMSESTTAGEGGLPAKDERAVNLASQPAATTAPANRPTAAPEASQARDGAPAMRPVAGPAGAFGAAVDAASRPADAQRPIEAGEFLRLVYGGHMGVSRTITVARDGTIVVAGYDGRLPVAGLTPADATARANGQLRQRSATAAVVEIRRPTPAELAVAPVVPARPSAVAAAVPATAPTVARQGGQAADELIDLVIVLQREPEADRAAATAALEAMTERAKAAATRPATEPVR